MAEYFVSASWADILDMSPYPYIIGGLLTSLFLTTCLSDRWYTGRLVKTNFDPKEKVDAFQTAVGSGLFFGICILVVSYIQTFFVSLQEVGLVQPSKMALILSVFVAIMSCVFVMKTNYEMTDKELAPTVGLWYFSVYFMSSMCFMFTFGMKETIGS
jgi:hypothetical protein